MGMAQRANHDSGSQIEVALFVDIPNVISLAALKHEIKARIRRDNILLEQLANPFCFILNDRRLRRWQDFLHNTTSVPTPASVKISSRTECGILPSTNWTFSTPLSIAANALSTFGIIPSPITPVFRNCGTSPTAR